MKNIEYKSTQISDFYKSNRMSYDDFYESEKKIIEAILNKSDKKSILDIGCACGGLGKALSEQFNISSYTGIDINKEAIDWAKEHNKLPIQFDYIYGDILHLNPDKADIVFSLGCADWNIETKSIIQKSWENVKEGGYLILSLRLTNQKSINNINESYQYIDFFNKNTTKEKANYVVFNIFDTFKIFNTLEPNPSLVNAYGYYGKPSHSAKTPYNKLLFSVFALKKDSNSECIMNLDFPLDIFL